MNKSPLQTFARMLVLAAVYFCAGKLGLMLSAAGPYITLIWLPSGIATAEIGVGTAH